MKGRISPARAGALAPLLFAGLFGGAAQAGSLGLTPLSPLARETPGQKAPAPGSPEAYFHRIAVFGKDDRISVPRRYAALKAKIGMLFNNRARTLCTAFCVAPDVVATAAHCLFRTSGRTRPRHGDYWFAIVDRGRRTLTRIAGHGRGTASQNILAGSTQLRIRPPIDAASDWALVRLSRPACRHGSLALRHLDREGLIRAAKDRRIFQVSFHRDYKNWQLAYSQPCRIDRRFGALSWRMVGRDFANPKALILHRCDTGGASSGSPILLDAPGGPYAVGINVGTYIQSKVLIRNGRVARRYKARIIANTGVDVSAFADAIARLRSAEIIGSREALMDLQQRLKARGHYLGRIDGAFGPLTRAAVMDFERHSGQPVTGLPTEALLRALGGGRAASAPGEALGQKSRSGRPGTPVIRGRHRPSGQRLPE